MGQSEQSGASSKRCDKGNPAVRRVYAKPTDLSKGGRAAAAAYILALIFATALAAFLVALLAASAQAD